MSAVQQKKIPLRRCLGCDTSKPKKELVRVVRTPEGEIRTDLTGKLNGRGAYVCRDPECFRKLRRSKRLDRTFGEHLSDELYDALEKAVTGDG